MSCLLSRLSSELWSKSVVWVVCSGKHGRVSTQAFGSQIPVELHGGAGPNQCLHDCPQRSHYNPRADENELDMECVQSRREVLPLAAPGLAQQEVVPINLTSRSEFLSKRQQVMKYELIHLTSFSKRKPRTIVFPNASPKVIFQVAVGGIRAC